MKYTMYKYDANVDMWRVYAQLNSKEELLRFLCYGTHTYNGMPRHRWFNPYFDEQNLTFRDILTNTRWERARDDNGEFRYDEKGYPVYNRIYERTIRPWHLEDSEGRTVDARIFKEEVYDMVENMAFFMRNTLYRRTYSPSHKNERQGRSYHHAGHYRCSPNNHRYMRTLKTVEGSAEDVEEILTSHQMQALKVKPKDNYARFCWGDDFWTYGPAGWKEHKNVHQWEPRQKRVNAVWVEGINTKKQNSLEEEYFIQNEAV